jgi:hypothetical protein
MRFADFQMHPTSVAGTLRKPRKGWLRIESAPRVHQKHVYRAVRGIVLGPAVEVSIRSLALAYVPMAR